MKVRGVDFVFYPVTNFKKSFKFYKGTLGLKVLGEASDSWTEFDTGNVTLAIGSMGKKVKLGGAVVALAIDDVGKAIKELKKKKVKIQGETYDGDTCTMATISDLDGNQIYLHKRKDGSVG